MNTGILIVAETGESGFTPSNLEAVSLAKRIKGWTDCETQCVVVGNHPEDAAKKLAEHTGINVLAVVSLENEIIENQTFCHVLTVLAKKTAAEYIIMPHTPTGMDRAPGLAAKLKGAYIPAVEGASKTDDGPAFSRAVFGGKTLVRVLPKTSPAVLTVQPGAFKPSEPGEKPGNVEILRIDVPPAQTAVLGFSDTDQGGEDITKADVIVAAGRGIGSIENLELIQRLASLFPKSAVAGSRPVCDNGWLEYGRQVGMTGRTVTPKLYISCGISGARQHTVGMQGSGFIVAVSADPGAAIFSTADIGIVEDLTEFIPILLEEYQKRQG